MAAAVCFAALCVALGAGGLGDTTLHHVYSESTGTGELTASMKPGQHPAAAAAAGGGPGLRAGSRRRSSVGRRARSSLAAEAIPEEAATPQPQAAAAAAAEFEAEFTFDTGAAAVAGRGAADNAAADSPQQQQLDGTEPLDRAAAAAAAAITPARGAADDLTQEMDMDISAGLGGATPGLLGDSHLTPMHGWRQQQQQQTPMQQQQQQHEDFDMVPESPEGATAGPAADDADACANDDAMDVDGSDENAPPASPGASPAAAAAAAADVDALTTNLLLDDHRQLSGWGHVPLGGTEARPSLGGAGGLTTHTGRGSVGSNVLTMHTVSCFCCGDWLSWGGTQLGQADCLRAGMLHKLPTAA